MPKKLLLVDASSSVFRAFFAIPAFTNSAGVPTNAALGFTTMLQKLLRESRPDYVAVVWDAAGPKRRKAMYAEYKATRDATPELLRAQFPWIRRIVAAYQLAALEYEGEEADDLIATLARSAERAGIAVEIASTIWLSDCRSSAATCERGRTMSGECGPATCGSSRERSISTRRSK